MADLATTKLDQDSHLMLEQPLLRLPHELLRKNLKSAQRHIETTNKGVTTSLAAGNNNDADALAAIEATLAKAQNLKRKLEALHAEEKSIQKSQHARIQHLQDLHSIQGLTDVRYERWAHVRLDRLLVDYLLRQGYMSAASELAKEKQVEDLVDVGVFQESGRIEAALERGEMKEALAWCSDNKTALKKIDSKLETQLRLQQFIEMRRSRAVNSDVKAIEHARKYLGGEQGSTFGTEAAGLLVFPPDTHVEPYKKLYHADRYKTLAALFRTTFQQILALPSAPLLYIALSAGLSALKTPSCHSAHALSNTANTGAPVCPICSTELNELARNVPYAHHTKSYIEDDPVVLPNGRVFGRERLKRLNEKLGTAAGKVKDPTDTDAGTEWDEQEIAKVYIS